MSSISAFVRPVSRWPALAAMLLSLCCGSLQARVITFDYVTGLGPVEGDGPLEIWIPLAAQTGSQRVLDERIDSPVPGRIETEQRYGNRYWHARVPAAAAQQGLTIRISSTVELSPHSVALPVRSGALGPQEREDLALYLGANQKVPVGHAILEPILAEVRAAAPGGDAPALARAIYDWVVDNIEYKKVGTGWGNGDTFWACREGYGNCTDFHALFISLARTVGIPARFRIGFPLPPERSSATVAGYHCWVEFYLPDTGWVPVDASEAAKHPEQREFLFGSQGADRILFTTGRDLVLNAAQRSGPLNYFIYPHVERAGLLYRGAVVNRFAYAETGAYAETAGAAAIAAVARPGAR